MQVEFASVNPTGPLHIGHGRGVILGDALCRLLSFTGHSVQREYYVNDQNTQAKRFGASVYARLHGEEPPEGGYAGAYVADQRYGDVAVRTHGHGDAQVRVMPDRYLHHVVDADVVGIHSGSR